MCGAEIGVTHLRFKSAISVFGISRIILKITNDTKYFQDSHWRISKNAKSEMLCRSINLPSISIR